ncbi:MAG TPA: type II toxin-antitoxin system VapC family toxin [Vicinamibacterales bacterium]|jgi:PIN domain nuclease of toxin-antitoxin system|nr:type II toxin-antitoxin system VapC family toxin [Vicinamibacterales bacterium]
MMVLDTHAWIWWAAGSSRLPAAARHAIDGAEAIGVCAISTWEVAMLVEKGRLEFDRDVLVWLKQALALPRVELLPLSPAVAVESARLPSAFPGDPADRFIVATTMLLRARLVSRDARVRRFAGITTVWN